MLLNKQEINFLQFLISEEIGWNRLEIADRENGIIDIDPNQILDEIEKCQERIKALEQIDCKLKAEKERIDKLQEN